MRKKLKIIVMVLIGIGFTGCGFNPWIAPAGPEIAQNSDKIVIFPPVLRLESKSLFNSRSMESQREEITRWIVGEASSGLDRKIDEPEVLILKDNSPKEPGNQNNVNSLIDYAMEHPDLKSFTILDSLTSQYPKQVSVFISFSAHENTGFRKFLSNLGSFLALWMTWGRWGDFNKAEMKMVIVEPVTRIVLYANKVQDAPDLGKPEDIAYMVGTLLREF